MCTSCLRSLPNRTHCLFRGVIRVHPRPSAAKNVLRRNEFSPVVSAAPFTTYRERRRIYPSQVLVKAPEGGLDADSLILAEQVRVLDKKRLLRWRGELTPATIARLNEALRIAFDLD